MRWFDQSRRSRRDSLIDRSHGMTGNPQEILRVLQDKRRLEPAGEPSLQNGLEMARSGMRSVLHCRS